MNILFTSDTHFNHTAIIAYSHRPFSTVEEMNEAMIERWNSRVGKADIVYHLGDFAWHKAEQIVRRLKGQKFLIEGSHDREAKRLRNNFVQITPMKIIKVEDKVVVLSHCAMRVWERKHYGAWHLFGHSHGMLDPFGKSFDVGVDTHAFFPYYWEEVKERMATLEDVAEDKRYERWA